MLWRAMVPVVLEIVIGCGLLFRRRWILRLNQDHEFFGYRQSI